MKVKMEKIVLVWNEIAGYFYPSNGHVGLHWGKILMAQPIKIPSRLLIALELLCSSIKLAMISICSGSLRSARWCSLVQVKLTFYTQPTTWLLRNSTSWQKGTRGWSSLPTARVRQIARSPSGNLSACRWSLSSGLSHSLETVEQFALGRWHV